MHYVTSVEAKSVSLQISGLNVQIPVLEKPFTAFSIVQLLVACAKDCANILLCNSFGWILQHEPLTLLNIRRFEGKEKCFVKRLHIMASMWWQCKRLHLVASM